MAVVDSGAPEDIWAAFHSSPKRVPCAQEGASVDVRGESAYAGAVPRQNGEGVTVAWTASFEPALPG
jgi:hypothetical protein